MAVKYLNIPAEEAYDKLSALTTAGYLAWQAIEEIGNKSSGNPDGLDQATKDTVNDMFNTWVNQTYSELQRIYVYKKEALSFLKVRIIGSTFPGQDKYITDTIGHIEARLALLTKYTDQLTSRFEINFIAGRDNNVQFGGSDNKQEVKNEGQ